MVFKIDVSRERKKMIFILLFVFLMLIIFYKWQVTVSNSYLFLGNKNYNNKIYDEALKNYKYALTIDGNRSIAYEARINRASIFYEHGNLEKAEQEIYRAINEKKSDHIAYEIMGDIYYAKRNIVDAMTYYNKSNQIKNSKQVRIKVGKSFIAKGENEKAYNIFSQLLQDNNDSEVLYYLGLLDFYDSAEYNTFFQQIEKKSDDYEFELKTLKESSENYYNIKNNKYKNILIADLYNKINQPYLAMNKLKENGEDDIDYRDAWIILGKSSFILGDYEMSAHNFQKAFDLDGHNAEISFWLESSLERMKDR